MKYNIDLDIKIQKIYGDLDILDSGHFYENDPVPGVPSYQKILGVRPHEIPIKRIKKN